MDQTKKEDVTFEDVVRAVGEDDPRQWSAGKLAKAIGHGSQSTHHKHLQVLRQAWVAKLQPPAPTTIPTPPVDAMGTIWAAAYAAAEVVVRRRLDALASERNNLAMECKTAGEDLDQANALIDEQVAAMADLRDLAALADLQTKLAEDLGEQLQRQVGDLTATVQLSASEHERNRLQTEREHTAARTALLEANNAATTRLAEARFELSESQRQNGALSERIKTLEASIQTLETAAKEQPKTP